jgi:2-polyprenyl-3-methyl-5-hydroxy-6-metoxy-1,4-benzoquinol methylase
MDWTEHQEWEKEWHSNCVNSLNEELKQLVYARKMGLKQTHNNKTPYIFKLGGISVLDIGGGPYSLLLKCEDFSEAIVADPCEYPEWVYMRYESAGIAHSSVVGEEIDSMIGFKIFDEVWIYNVLQHTMSPETIIRKAFQASKIIRIFEWIDTGIAKGHPNDLHEEDLNKWLGGIGKVEQLNEGGCVGKAYYGVFKGAQYEK